MNPILKDQLRRLEETHINIEVRKSKEKLADILADDFFEIGSSGRMFDIEECLRAGVAIAEMEIHHYEIHPLAPDVVLATYFLTDKTRNRNTLRNSIWKWIDGRWQLYFHQGTITDMKLSEVETSRFT
ncbi:MULTISPECIES: DUF4440 domain-containing protein [Allobacillus]|uniref:DUF4440 domain-containing protein n=1 Tax=Allobacillus salarius TaxID=1955272 RepID=A0A556PA68_9BACI|nr:DUF4440 domain-containing protein [Allobacillus salarius]TSJ61265.1 DUF4440 domain-containing protein [Allobacillus salarius]